MIVRIAHREHFTVIRNKTLRDSRLSFKARGLLAYLLSLPDNSTVDRDRLAKVGPDGLRAIRSALQELTETGYLRREQSQGPDGKWRTETTLYELPHQPRTAGAKRATAGAKTASANRASRSPSKTKDGPRYDERAPAHSFEQVLERLAKRIPDA